jgi:hypothetical protein
MREQKHSVYMSRKHQRTENVDTNTSCSCSAWEEAIAGRLCQGAVLVLLSNGALALPLPYR